MVPGVGEDRVNADCLSQVNTYLSLAIPGAKKKSKTVVPWKL
jgi:hypothetical protein